MKLVTLSLITSILLQGGVPVAYAGLAPTGEGPQLSNALPFSEPVGPVQPDHLTSRSEAFSSSGCDASYPEGFLRACYYEGTEPGIGAFLGSEDEAGLGSPVPDRAFGINHDWDQGPVFAGITPGAGGIENDISGVWRGRLFFNAGRFQFTAFAWDGVRLFIDEQLLIDEWVPQEFWYRFGAVIELAEGFHDVRVEWFATGLTPDATLLRLHWDRVPTVAKPQVSPIIIDVFLLKQHDTCIVGDPWVSGEQVAIYNPDGTLYRAWQRDDVHELPRALAPSDPTLSNYAQVECFSFGYSPEELPGIKDEVDGFAALIEGWSGGDIQPHIRLFEIEAEVNLARIGTTWWVPPWEMASITTPLMTAESDFAIVLSSNFDLQTRRSYSIFGCGAAFGVELYANTFGGTGYSWVPCVESLIILHEWEHQLTAAMRHLLGFESLYPDTVNYTGTGYPACGTGDPDIFKWFPDSEDWGVDPDSPWCGFPEVVGIAELHLFAHLDASLSHYPIGFFTGNHCNNGFQDLGESDIDTGSNCPPRAVQETFELAPVGDAWVQVGARNNTGDSMFLRVQNQKKVTFLKFDLRGVTGNVSSAILTLAVAQPKVGTVSVHAVSNTAWHEGDLDGKNAPPIGEVLASAAVTPQRGQAVSWEVTPFIAAALASGADAVSFALVTTEPKQLAFYSKEYTRSSQAPLLVITSE